MNVYELNIDHEMLFKYKLLSILIKTSLLLSLAFGSIQTTVNMILLQQLPHLRVFLSIFKLNQNNLRPRGTLGRWENCLAIHGKK